MNIVYSAVSNVWYRCAGTWGAAFFLFGLDLLLIRSASGRQVIPWEYFILAWVAIPLLMCLLGRYLKECDRVLAYVLIFGTFAVLPVIITLLVTSTVSAFYIVRENPGFVSVLPYLFAVFTVGVLLNFWRIQKKIKQSGFLVKEFKIRSGGIFVSRLPDTDPYVAGEPSRHSRWILHTALPISVFFIVAGYGLQRAVISNFGDGAFFLVLSAICLPYAFHCLSQYLGGAYLWVYLVYKMERKHRKKVLFLRVCRH